MQQQQEMKSSDAYMFSAQQEDNVAYYGLATPQISTEDDLYRQRESQIEESNDCEYDYISNY